MTDGEWWTKGSAWLAFAAWVGALVGAKAAREHRASRGPDILWLLGAVVLLLHTALAFHVYHAWSHAAAVADTARQTRALTGLDWGGGVWLNYALLAVWLGDALWRLFAPARHAVRPRFLAAGTHVFLAFIWFNATVVFGSWPMRAAGLAGFALLIANWWRGGVRRSPS